jgi:radical SAM-linked protein
VETVTEAASAPDATPTEPRAAPPEARQRWRLTFCRDRDPSEHGLGGRDYSVAWEDALGRSGLPIAETAAGRLRFSLAAPLPTSASGEAELAELWLTARVPTWRLREALTPTLPAGHRITDVEDVWMGAPALTGRVAAADYRLTLADEVDERAVAAACGRLLEATSLPRSRAKGGAVKSYDLRRLLISIQIGGRARADTVEGRPERVVVRLRTRIHPELGSGRPEEVLAALGDELGIPIEAAETVRERLVLADELDR